MKRLIIFIICAIIILHYTNNTYAFSRPEDHVVLKGKILNIIKNVPIKNIRVYAFKKNKIEPIPFQIDKVNLEGVYILDISDEKEMIEERKEAYEDALDDNDCTKEKLHVLKMNAEWLEDMSIFDDQDELVFMAWDLGKRAKASMLPKASKIEEIAITNPIDKNTAYAYVAFFDNAAPPVSPVKYVNYFPEEDIVDADYYVIKYVKDHPLVFSDVKLKRADGSLTENYIDRMKMRIKIDVKYFFTINLDENNSDGKLVAFKIGPVRVIKRILFWVELMFIRVTPKVRIDFVYYPNGLIAPGELNIPMDPKTFLNEDSNFFAGQDFSKIIVGAKMYTEKISKPVEINGKNLDDNKEIDLTDQNWYVVYREGKDGIFLQMTFDERLKDLKSNVFFLDDNTVNLKPERIPGQHLLAISANLRQFQIGRYGMNIYMYLDRAWKRGKEKRFLNFIANPLQAKAKVIK